MFQTKVSVLDLFLCSFQLWQSKFNLIWLVFLCYTLFFMSNTFISNVTLSLAKNWAKAKQQPETGLFYLKIIHFLHPCYHPKIMGKIPEAVVQRCSLKKEFLEISQNSQESTCARVSFLIKLQTCLRNNSDGCFCR